MRKRWKIVGGLAAFVVLGPIAALYIQWTLDMRSIAVDVTNSSGHPLRMVSVDCASSGGASHRSLGDIASGEERTVSFPVEASKTSRFKPEYNITLRFVGSSRNVASRTISRYQGSWIEFDIQDGDQVQYVVGQAP